MTPSITAARRAVPNLRKAKRAPGNPAVEADRRRRIDELYKFQPVTARHWLLNELPPSVNDLYFPVKRGKHITFVMKPAAREWHKRTQLFLARGGKRLWLGPLAVEFTFFVGMVTADVSNRIKALEDACTGVLWHDDLQVVDLHVRKELGSPGVVVGVTPATCEPELTERILYAAKGGPR